MLTLICGHPRAGKTTYSQKFDNVIHLDEEHSTQRVLQKIKGRTDDVVVEGIYYRPSERQELIKVYKGERTRCICLNTSKEIREQRHGYRIRHDYPFLLPNYDEGWDEIIIIEDNNDESINYTIQT